MPDQNTETKTQPPQVSVVLCVYNGERYLREAIESILDQTFSDFEFIIVDDGSTDGTWKIVDSYCDRRIVGIRQENVGLTAALIRALASARAPLIARQDADDISMPERLARQTRYLADHEEIALVGSGITLIDETGNPLGEYAYPTEHHGLYRDLYTQPNPLPHSSVMFRVKAVSEVGGYRPFFVKAQDYDLLLRLADRHRIASIPSPLLRLRCRTGSVSVEDSSAEQWKFALLALVFAKLRKELSVDMLAAHELPRFLEEFEAWFAQSGIPERFISGKLRVLARQQFSEHRFLPTLHSLAASWGKDPHWPWRRLVGKHVIHESEIEHVVQSAKKLLKIGE